MNPPDHDHPALTAYALGELAPAEAATISRMIATSPEIRAEYERIARAVASLKNAPAIPRRALHPRQRETLLAMGQLPARSGKVLPFGKPCAPSHRLAWSLAGLATAAALAIGAFIAGFESAPRLRSVMATGTSEIPSETTSPAPAPQSPAVPESQSALAVVPPQPAPDVADSSSPIATTGVVEAPQPAPAPATVVQVPPPPAPTVAPDTAPVLVPARAPQPSVVVSQRASAPAAAALRSFVITATTSESAIALQPRLMRAVSKPVPREFAGQVLAAPLPPDRPKSPAPNSAPRKPAPQPQLIIHSWKAEVASCPWDHSRRLMRLVAQIPVDQDGVESNTRPYQISVKFDPAQVQAWRLITERHMPPAGGSTLATRFAWYEIVPGRNFAPMRDKPAALGTLDIIQPNGAMRDSQPLRLLDRGLSWNEAREDFVFETAMVGFNLLLQGTENIGGLNHKLVLDLAEQSRDEDPKGERAKFIGVVKQAQKAAGL